MNISIQIQDQTSSQISSHVDQVVSETKSWSRKEWSSKKRNLGQLVIEVNKRLALAPDPVLEEKKENLRSLFARVREAAEHFRDNDVFQEQFYQMLSLQHERQKQEERHQKALLSVEEELARALLKEYPDQDHVLNFVIQGLNKQTLEDMIPSLLQTCPNPSRIVELASSCCSAHRLTNHILDYVPTDKLSKVVKENKSWMQGHAKNTVSHSSLLRQDAVRLNQVLSEPLFSFNDLVVLHADLSNPKSKMDPLFFHLFAKTLSDRLVKANGKGTDSFLPHDTHRVVNEWVALGMGEAVQVFFDGLPSYGKEKMAQCCIEMVLSNQSRLIPVYKKMAPYLNEEGKVKVLKDVVLSGRFGLVKDISEAISQERFQKEIWEITQKYWEEKCPTIAMVLDRRDLEQKVLKNDNDTQAPRRKM